MSICAELGDPCGAPLPLVEAVVCAARLRSGKAAGLPQVHHICPVVFPDFLHCSLLSFEDVTIKASGGVPAPLHLEPNRSIYCNNTAVLQVIRPCVQAVHSVRGSRALQRDSLYGACF